MIFITSILRFSMKKTIKIIILIIIFLNTVLIMTSCTKKNKNTTPSLRIATNAEYPPFEFKENDQFKGVDIELAELLAQKLDMKYEIFNIDFDMLFPSLINNKYDLALSAITITEKRQKKVDFSIPYYTANQAIIAHKTSEIKIKEEKELSHYKIGVQKGTTGKLHIENNLIIKNKMKKENLISYSSNVKAIDDMIAGKIDLVIIDDSVAKGYSRLKPIKSIYIIETNEEYGIALPKNSPYTAKINKALKEIMNSEDWVKIISKYL